MLTLRVWKTSPGRRADRSDWSLSRDWTMCCSSVNTVGGLMVRVPTYLTDPNPSMLRWRLPNRRRISSSAESVTVKKLQSITKHLLGHKRGVQNRNSDYAKTEDNREQTNIHRFHRRSYEDAVNRDRLSPRYRRSISTTRRKRLIDWLIAV